MDLSKGAIAHEKLKGSKQGLLNSCLYRKIPLGNPTLNFWYGSSWMNKIIIFPGFEQPS